MSAVAGPRNSATLRSKVGDRPKKIPDQPKARKGGKSRMQRPMDDLLLDPVLPGDPNYVPDEGHEEFSGEWVVPTPSVDEFKPIISAALNEYLTSSDVDDFIVGLEETGATQATAGSGLAPELVKRALLLALDRKQRDREQISRLLAALYQRGVLSPDQTATGFALLLKDDEYLSDLQLDSPDALTALAQFVARAVVDDVLPASFLSLEPQEKFTPGSEHGVTVLARATTIHSAHIPSLIGKIWGPGDGRPVEQRKREISLLLGEYLIGGDIAEATRCTRELESPYYMHELVKQAIVATVDKSSVERNLVMQLFQHLYTEQVLRGNQILQGFERTLERMDDLTLDVPNALEVFRDGFVTPATSAGWLPESFAARCVPMSEVKQRIVSMIEEYFDNGEAGVAEATRCLDEMGMDHLHGQILKKLCVKAMDGKTDRERQLASLLIFSWRQSDKISAGAVHAGFTSLLTSLGDISLDVPDAETYLDGFVRRAQHDGLLPDNFIAEQRTAAASSPRR